VVLKFLNLGGPNKKKFKNFSKNLGGPNKNLGGPLYLKIWVVPPLYFLKIWVVPIKKHGPLYFLKIWLYFLKIWVGMVPLAPLDSPMRSASSDMRAFSRTWVNCKLTPEQWTWLLCSVSVVPANKLLLQEINQSFGIELLTSNFLENFSP